MKTVLKISAALIIPILYFAVISGFNATTENLQTKQTLAVITAEPKDFIMFPLNISSKAENYGWNTEKLIDPINYISELNFNAAHIYDEWDGSDRLGRFSSTNLSPGQIHAMNDIINTAENNGLSSVFERANISRLCYGQRLIYEAEGGNFGFSYSSTTGLIETDDGRTVVHGCTGTVSCSETDATPRYLCSAIEENMMHSDLQWFRPGKGDYSTWHLKPVMKIRTQDFSYTSETPVVTIEVRDFNGDILDNIIIRIRNFRDGNNQYNGGNGGYIDVYNFIFEPGNPDLNIPGDETPNGLNRNWDKNKVYNETVGVDFRVFWHGNVDVWFDKMVVDDEDANDLFRGDHDLRMTQELDTFVLNPEDKAINTFFVDECSFSNIPCIKYVQNFIRSYNTAHNTNARLSYATSNNLNTYSWKNDGLDHAFNLFLDSTRPQYFQIDAHCIYYDPGKPGYIPSYALPGPFDGKIPTSWFCEENEYDNYNNYLQKLLGTKVLATNPIPNEGSFVFQVWQARSQLDANSPETRLVVQPQIQHWGNAESQGGKFTDGVREPTNEEISAQAWIALAYGADAICWFWIPTTNGAATEGLPLGWRRPQDGETPWSYVYGLLDNPTTRRTKNLYGQNKYYGVSQINAKILSIKSTLDAITWKSAYSVHSEGAGHEFISNILSIDPHRNDYNACPHDGPSGPYYDCEWERYWEMGFYNDLNGAKYFTMVNRRCVPANTGVNPPLNGDDRVLRIKFNLPGSNSWKLSEVGNSNAPVEFNKNAYAILGNTPGTFGWFKPGEGKLFKLQQVPKSGGTLVADEIISGETYTCEAPVYNNGHNITIGANTTIHFTDSARFVMNGGVFTVGDRNTSAPQNITSDAVTGSSWHGHSFTNCEVNIYGATFSGLANDTTYAVNIIDCPVVDIRGCTFNTNNSLKGGINAVYFTNLNAYITNIYIGGNTFNSSGSTLPTLNVSSYAGVTTPLIIENNTFTEGNTAIFLSGVTGGAVKGNTINDNYIGINALTSQVDISENTVSSTIHSSTGIFASGGSELKMNSSGSISLGGHNSISNEGTGTNNINVDGSTFLLDGGENIFNIIEAQTSYHLHGYFPQLVSGPFDETNNCFKLNNSPVNPPYEYVTSGYLGTQITFNFTPYLTGCEYNQCQDYVVVDLGGGVYDTICTGNSGSSGGENNLLPLVKGEYPKGEGVEKQLKGAYFTPQSAKEKYDTVCVLMRYRNYSQAKTKCLDLINSYPDSIQSLNAVSKLFLATVASDTTYNAVNNLKIYFEELILNHQSNTSLVKRANYFILKCKVRMREYSQALAGFQQIINQNPYSYEGLIARWDYMATSLLVQGQGGAYSSIDNDQLTMKNKSDESYEFDKFEELGDDRSPFTKEQRQDIRKSINTAIEISKNDDETKMKTLEVKSDLGDVNASRELTQMKSLKQIVKTEKPKSITEHIKIVSEDIRKVFGINTSGKGNEPKNLPTVFRISQNYPNPFNPTTKINYDLPRDSKVNIVIYDILGREVKRLINNDIKQAGSYIVDFNASNYASGVYFYRIEAEEPNGNKFADSKKMVLLK